jgi:hypothetical protein
MPKLIARLPAVLIPLSLSAALAGLWIGAGAAAAADIQEKPAGKLRLSEYSARSCVEDCITRCRAAKAQCGGGKDRGDECRAQFQICARRCVVSCNPR